MRLLGLLFALFLSLVIVYFSVLFWGLGRTLPQFSNALLEKPTPWIVHPWDRGENWPLDSGTEMLWVDVVRDAKGLIRAVPSTEVVKLDKLPATPSLKELSEKTKTCCLVVNILSNVEDIDHQVSNELGKEWEGRVLIQSEYDPVLTQMQSQRPFFAYGTSAPDRLRWLTYQSLHLLPAVNYNRDVYISPLKIGPNTAVSQAIVNEVHRRKRKIMIGPLHTADEALEAKKFAPDAYFLMEQTLLDALRDKH